MMVTPTTRTAVASCCRSTLLRRHAMARRSLSSSSAPPAANSNLSNNNPTASQQPQPQQPFVQARIRPGEPNPDEFAKGDEKLNPLYRPEYKSRAKILSLDDFAKQPSVGFSGEYESFQDAAVTLGWLDQQDQAQIYQLYTDLMEHAVEKNKMQQQQNGASGGGEQQQTRTSHEYIMRVIAQKYNLTAERVAAIVQLQHNEEQMKQDPNVTLLTEAADYMDNAIKQEIRAAYKEFGLKQPDEFVEDPPAHFARRGQKERKSYQVADDLLDVEQMLQDAVVRQDKEARLAIDGHVYVEDVPDDKVQIPMSADSQKLLKAHAKFQKEQKDAVKADDSPSIIDWPTGPGRERWKYVAQTINTRDLKKKKKKKNQVGGGKSKRATTPSNTSTTSSYTNTSPENTLVEHNGRLSAGTMADVYNTAWKPVRNVSEHTYRGAKQGWLKRQLQGDTKAWGKATVVVAKTSTTTTSRKNAEEEEKKADSESSGDESGGESGGDEEEEEKEERLDDDNQKNKRD